MVACEPSAQRRGSVLPAASVLSRTDFPREPRVVAVLEQLLIDEVVWPPDRGGREQPLPAMLCTVLAARRVHDGRPS